jgi:hypothetical protein
MKGTISATLLGIVLILTWVGYLGALAANPGASAVQISQLANQKAVDYLLVIGFTLIGILRAVNDLASTMKNKP